MFSRGVAFLLAGLLSTGGCAGTWVPATHPLDQALRSPVPQRVRITRLDQSQLVLRAAVVRADSLVGVPEVEGWGGGTLAVALVEIQSWERWYSEDEKDAKEIAAFFVGVLGAALLLFVTTGFPVPRS